MEGEDVIAVFESIKNIYRFDFDLKKEQINIIQLILNERHVFGLLPTGFGKSVCYILPPLMLDEVSIQRGVKARNGEGGGVKFIHNYFY